MRALILPAQNKSTSPWERLRTVILVFIPILLSCGAQPTAVGTSTPPPSPSGNRETSLSQVPSASTTTAPRMETEWLAILLDGHKTGYLKSTRTFANGEVTTAVTTVTELQRGGTVNRMKTVSTTVETLGGDPIRFEKVTEGSGMQQRIVGTLVSNGRLRITTEAGGTISSRETEWPEGALMTEGQRQEALEYGLESGVTYTSRYFDPDLLDALEVTVTVKDTGPLDLLGRIVTATRVDFEMTVHGTTLTLKTFVDAEMNTLMTESERMGMRVEMIACTEQYARSDNDPMEMLEAALIDAPKPLSEKRRQKPITYTVSGLDAAARAAVVNTDEQQVKEVGDTLEITVSPLKPKTHRAGTLPYTGDDETARRALGSTEWLQSDAPEITALSEQARNGATDPFIAAKNIERFVSEYIDEKSFSVGYASASEVAQSRQGDCTEHALLTAALCRAAGIPADVVFGLVYVDQYEDRKRLFGGHAWTRAFVDGKWRSLDAALGAFDSGHIALTLSDGDPSDFFKIIDVVGNFRIDSIR